MINVINVIDDLGQFNSKRVLFITTKRLSYIRNVQETGLLYKSASMVDIVGADKGSYSARLLPVYIKTLYRRLRGFKDCDEIFIGFAPQLVLPVLLMQRRLRKKRRAYKPVTIDFFISLYDTMCLDRKRFKPDGLVGKLLHRLDAICLKSADHIICDTIAHGRFFAEEFGAAPDKMSVLYIKADKRLYHPMGLDREKVLCEIFGRAFCKGKERVSVMGDTPAFSGSAAGSKCERTVIFYFGSVLPLQGTDMVIEAMNTLSEDPGYICVFIGPVKKLKNVSLSGRVYHREWLTEADIARLADIADICLAGHFNEEIDKAKRTIPGKAFIYEALDKPMILGDNEANREYFKESDKHIFIPMGSSDEIVKAVSSAFSYT